MDEKIDFVELIREARWVVEARGSKINDAALNFLLQKLGFFPKDTGWKNELWDENPFLNVENCPKDLSFNEWQDEVREDSQIHNREVAEGWLRQNLRSLIMGPYLMLPSHYVFFEVFNSIRKEHYLDNIRFGKTSLEVDNPPVLVWEIPWGWNVYQWEHDEERIEAFLSEGSK